MRDRSEKPVKVAEKKMLLILHAISAHRNWPPADLERIARRQRPSERLPETLHVISVRKK